MQRVMSAVRLLTILGRFRPLHLNAGDLDRNSAYFPAVGAAIGFGWSLLNNVAEIYLPSELLSVSLVAALVIATGAVHLEGLQTTLNNTGCPPLEAGKPHNGILGLIAVVLIVHLKINSLEALGDARNASLLLVPVLARWGVVILLYGTTSISAAYDRPRPIPLVLNTVLILALTLWIGSAVGLWIALSISLSALLVRTVLQWRQSVINCNHLGALVEITEALSLAAFAAL